MKIQRQIAPILATLFLVSCAGFSDQTITTAVSVGTTTALRFAINDSAKRTMIANYIDVGAAGLRTVSGTPTPEELTSQINAFIPAKIKAEFPEVLTFIEPILISQYQAAYKKYGNGKNVAKTYAVLNDIAVGLETGASPYITKKG